MGKSKRGAVSIRKRPTTPAPFNPVQFREGEILTDINHKKWRLGKAVGVGGFGEIYLVSDEIHRPVPQDAVYAVKIEPHHNGPLFVEMNFYLRVAKKEIIEKWEKERDLSHLGMPHYIAFGSHNYLNDKYRFLVLQRFGQDIEKVFIKNKRKLHIKTVLTLGIQILDILEYIHSLGYIHADVKGSNLLLGTGKQVEERVYLLDYGLACRYVDSLGEHKDYNPDQRKAHDGTLEYTSRDAHVGAHSRRGDLEVLGYNMVHWLSGHLPWDDICDPERVALEKTNQMNNLPSFLRQCFGDVEPPAVLGHYLKYVTGLSFETKPDYNYCKDLLRQGIRLAGFQDDEKLSINVAPTRLKRKRRNDDVENWPRLKPVKAPRVNQRQPCVPVQNLQRVTRRQSAATSAFDLRSRERFDWVKVLQSHPDRVKRPKEDREKRTKKKVSVTGVVTLKKEKANPWANPTPAMLEVLKMRNSSTTTCSAGKRQRSESHCSSPVFYAENTLTPAMEEVIRRREALKRLEQEMSFRPITTATAARAGRMRGVVKPVARKPTEKRRRKISAPEMGATRTRARKYSLQEQMPFVEKESKAKRPVRKCTKKQLPTSTKMPKRKTLKLRQKREVSPSETDFVPRLRSGTDQSEDFLLLNAQRPTTSATSPFRSIRNYVSSACGGGLLSLRRARSASSFRMFFNL